MKRVILFFCLISIVVLFKGHQVEGATSPYDVDSSVRNGWSNVYGGKMFPKRSGKHLVYDVYLNKFTRGGYRIVEKNFGNGKKQYINFQGWAVLFGYKRHTSAIMKHI